MWVSIGRNEYIIFHDDNGREWRVSDGDNIDHIIAEFAAQQNGVEVVYHDPPTDPPTNPPID